jgi:hypothetical protein
MEKVCNKQYETYGILNNKPCVWEIALFCISFSIKNTETIWKDMERICIGTENY